MSNSTPETSEKTVTSLSVSQASAARSDSARARSGAVRRGSSARSSARSSTPRDGSRSAPRSSSGTGGSSRADGSSSAGSSSEGKSQVKSRPRRTAPAKPVRVIRKSISAKMVMPPREGDQAAAAATAASAAAVAAADSAAAPAAGDTVSSASAGQLHRRKPTTSRAPDSVRRPSPTRGAPGKGRAFASHNPRRNQSRSEGQSKEAAENGQRPRSSRPSAPGNRRPAGKTGTSGAAPGSTCRPPRRASNGDAAERSSDRSTKRPSGQRPAPGKSGAAHPGKPGAAHPGKPGAVHPGSKSRPDGQHSVETQEQKAKTSKPAPAKSRANSVADAIKAARSRLRCMPAKYYFDRKGHVSQEMLFDPDSEGFNKLPSQVQLRSFSQLIKEKKAILAQHGIVLDQPKPKAVAANTAAAVVADAMEAADTAPAGASVIEQSDTGTGTAINTLVSGGTVALAQDSSASAVSDSNSAVVGSSGGQVTTKNNSDQE